MNCLRGYMKGKELIETLWNVNKDGCEYVAVDFT